MFNRFNLVAMALSLALLAACGGGASTPQAPMPAPAAQPEPEPAPEPEPEPTPPPPPPPPPPVPRNETMQNLTVDETFASVATLSTQQVAVEPGDPWGDLVTSSPANVSISYDVETSGFRVQAQQGAETFDETFTLSEVVAQDGKYIIYQDVDGNIFLLENPETSGFSYTAFGVWNSDIVPGEAFMAGGAFFGVGTLAAEMPTTGQATYQGIMDGGVTNLNTGEQNDLTGTFTLDANFAEGTLTGDFSPGYEYESSTVSFRTSWRDFSITTQINGPTFEGTAQTDDGLMNGDALGRFFGPNAEEIGGFWSLEGDGESAAGRFMGK